MYNQVFLDDSDKVDVESAVDNKINHLLAPIPPVVYLDVSVRDLQASRDPNVVDGYIDGSDEHGDADFESEGALVIGK